MSCNSIGFGDEITKKIKNVTFGNSYLEPVFSANRLRLYVVYTPVTNSQKRILILITYSVSVVIAVSIYQVLYCIPWANQWQWSPTFLKHGDNNSIFLLNDTMIKRYMNEIFKRKYNSYLPSHTIVLSKSLRQTCVHILLKAQNLVS